MLKDLDSMFLTDSSKTFTLSKLTYKSRLLLVEIICLFLSLNPICKISIKAL